MRCQGGQLRGSPVHRPTTTLRYGGPSETTGALAINSKRFLVVCRDCLQGSGASTLHAESKRELLVTTARLEEKPAVPVRILWFPSSTTADLLSEDQKKTCIRGAEGPTNTLQRGGKQARMVQDRDADRHSPAWNSGADSKHFSGLR